jgi:hypothetical protein
MQFLKLIEIRSLKLKTTENTIIKTKTKLKLKDLSFFLIIPNANYKFNLILHTKVAIDWL